MNGRRMEILKGLTILFILISNGFNYWLNSQGITVEIIAYIIVIFNLFGATFYIFLNLFNISFILEKKMGCIAHKKKRNKIIKQGLFLILLGIPFNMIITPVKVFPFNLWGWNILIFLGFSQIISYLAYKMVRWTRIIIGLAIIFLTSGIREVLFYSKDFHIILKVSYFIIVSPYPNYSLLPYAAFCFFATVFSEFIYEAKILESSIAEINAIKSVLKYGIVLLVVGLIIPFAEFNPIITESSLNMYPFLDMPSILKSQFLVFIPNLPGFLLKGTPANIFFSMGIALLLIGFIYYVSYYKQLEGKISRSIVLLGQNSLTILFLQFLVLSFFNQLIPLWFISFVIIIFLIGLGILVYLWVKFLYKLPTIDRLLIKLIS